MKKRIILITSVIALIILIIIKLVVNKSVIDENKKTKEGVKTTVSVKTVIKKEENSLLMLTGVTSPKQEVTLQAETSGQIESIFFSLGEYVTKGKVLIQIDDKLASLNLEQAQVNLSKFEDEYNKNKSLYNGNAISETRLRDAKIDFERAKISVEQAKKQLSFTKITATQSGYVTAKLIEKGAFVAPGTPLLSLVDISQLKVLINVAEKEAYKLKNGQTVTITSSVYPGWSTTGKVNFVSQQGDKVHNYPVEVLVNNLAANQLKAGTFVNVEFNFPAIGPSLLIPRESLIGSVKNAKVYVVENNIVSQIPITVGRDLGNNLEVLSGLNENDLVVTTGQINLSDNSPVIIINN